MTEELIRRLSAALEGRYAIERELGQGGMATVYLAEDLRHERKVALKVLKSDLAAVVGAERFLAEIKTTANLQHPHILPLHDSGAADGFLFYVMPYVDGESLRERLDRDKQLPVDEAVRIACAVGSALDAAHEQGVIHRDIKPANILLSRGEPLVADFGIALAVNAAGGARLTETGLSVGTPYYMSPEQASGDRELGPQSDVYALGCVLYEMLVGEPPFTGATAQAVLARILTGEAERPSLRRKTVPANVEAALLRALERLPADRFEHAADFVSALNDPGFTVVGPAAAGPAARADRNWKSIALTMTGVAVVASGLALRQALRPEPERPVVRYSIALPPTEGLFFQRGQRIALSPDGTRMAYVGVGEQESQLYVRERSRLRATPISGTRRAAYPAFSPDGQSLAFLNSSRAAQVVSLAGGPPITVRDPGATSVGLSWGPDDHLYLGTPTGLGRVSVNGGEVEPVTERNASEEEITHAWPDALPNGKGVLFTVFHRPVRDMTGYDIAVADLEAGAHRVLVHGVYARYATSGHLLYVTADGTLLAAPFDQDRLELIGPSVALVEGLAVGGLGSVNVSVSNAGVLMYLAGSPVVDQDQIVWVDRDGTEDVIDPEWMGDFLDLALSPDATRLAVGVLGGGGNQDIWIKQLQRGPPSKLTFQCCLNRRPAWSPDGEFVTFISDRLTQDLWQKPADGSSAAELLVDRERDIVEGFWSPDREWLVFRPTILESGGGDILAVRPGADTTATALVVTEFAERMPALSPDGLWLAYTSAESGQDEVHVRPFPNAAEARWQVSLRGGTQPMWAHSGNELFYRSSADSLVAVEIQTTATFVAGRQQLLFSAARYDTDSNHAQYDVAPDDQRFVFIRQALRGGVGELIVVENFFEELRERVGN